MDYRWSSDLAYVVGLMATDGNLSRDGRHLIFVSKDKEQIQNFKNILELHSKIDAKKSGYTGIENCFQIQFSNVKFYRFLTSIGLCTNKSKILTRIDVPDNLFADFLRGCLDGDGFTYSYWDKRWKSSFMLYLGFVSASINHLQWINDSILRLYGVQGKINSLGMSAYQLKYAKKNSLILLQKIYYCDTIPCLSRKRCKIQSALDIINQQAGMLKW